MKNDIDYKCPECEGKGYKEGASGYHNTDVEKYKCTADGCQDGIIYTSVHEMFEPFAGEIYEQIEKAWKSLPDTISKGERKELLTDRVKELINEVTK